MTLRRERPLSPREAQDGSVLTPCFTLVNVREVMLDGLENEDTLDKTRDARVTPNQVREGWGSSVQMRV